jgi:hypothetical protein
MMEAERPINVIKEEKIESFVQPDITSALDEDEEAFTDSVRKTSVKEQKQNVLKSSEQKIKETRQIKPQTATGSTISTSGHDTSNNRQPIRTTATHSSYPHHIPGYYSYPLPSAASSTAPISPHSFSEQIKGTTDTQEQEESKLTPTEEATESHSNTNVPNPYYNEEHLNSAHYPPSTYGWYPSYYPPPPGPQPRIPPQFYPSHSSSMPTDPNVPFTGWRPSKLPDMVPPTPGFGMFISL